MRKLLRALSWTALLGTLLPSVLFLSGSLEREGVATVMLLATLLWFATVPFWMERPR